MTAFQAPKVDKLQVARSEFKYHVRAEELPAIRRFLLYYCAPDENSSNGDWYSIRTLYLDNSDFFLYREAEDKAPFRFKLRARTYGDGKGGVKLEVKRRIRDLIVKSSASLRAPAWESAASNGLRGLLDAATPSMAEFLQLTDSIRASPRMLVYYERQAYSSLVDDYVRVTFDRNMACQPMPDWNLFGDPRSWLCVDAPVSFGERESAYVLEIKFSGSPPAWLRDLVLRFGLERRGFSKYGRSVQRGILGREAAWDLGPAGNWS